MLSCVVNAKTVPNIMSLILQITYWKRAVPYGHHCKPQLSHTHTHTAKKIPENTVFSWRKLAKKIYRKDVEEM